MKKGRNILYLLFVFFMGCSINNSPFKEINYHSISRVVVLNLYITDENGVTQREEPLEYEFCDSSMINELFVTYLNRAKKSKVKIFKGFQIIFFYEGEEYNIFLGGNCIVFDGNSYLLDSNLESYLVNKLGI